MRCSKCKTENPENAQFCTGCAVILTPNTQRTSKPIKIETSLMAIIALVLGVLSFVFAIFTGLPALVLGIISLVNIEKSGGKLTGKGFAMAGIITPIFSFALILFIVFPKVRYLAYRQVCGNNLAAIGKAMLNYANDNNNDFPRAGTASGLWNPKAVVWNAPTRQQAYKHGDASITSSLYLLAKYYQIAPSKFICMGDLGITEFKPATYDDGNNDVTQFWDFGPNGRDHCSYSYQQPYCKYNVLTISNDPRMTIAADPNPWLDKNAQDKRDFKAFQITGGKEFTKLGNAITHQDKGQNVLYLDGPVNFESVSFCGINDNNIYTQANSLDIKKGTRPIRGGAIPVSMSDNLLVIDYGLPPRRGRGMP